MPHKRRVGLLGELVRARAALSSAERALRSSVSESSLVDARAEVERLDRLLVGRRTLDNAILDGVEVGIATADDSGRATFLNRFGRELLQAGIEDGRDMCALLGLEASPEDLLGFEPRARFSSVVPDSSGGELDLDISLSRAGDDTNERLGFFFIFRDVAPEKRMESERQRLEHLAAMGTMVAGFAHEVRNPVASLRSLAESLNEELADSHIKLSHADRMLHVLARVERLVDTSLQFGRPAVPKRAMHHPWALLSGAANALSARTHAMDDHLRVEIEPDLPDAYVDEGQLVQVLVVLLENAIDAARAPSRVLLRAGLHRGEMEGRLRRSQPPPSSSLIRFEVVDEGPGISPELVARIFDPFFTTKATGIGLGLSIAQQLVHENGGRIEVATNLGGPTTFSVIVSGVDEALPFVTSTRAV